MTETSRPNTVTTGGRICAVVGFVLAVIAVFFYPIFFGPGAIILGAVAMTMGDKALGKWAIAAGVLGMIIGFVLGYIAVS